jgi:glycerol-3-phosphate dehydrogenase (NAD(P)+)
MTCRISIVGAGGWGTALAILLSRNNHTVRLWARNPAHAAELRDQKSNERYLSGVPIPDTVEITDHLADSVAGAEIVLFVTPSTALRQIAGSLAAQGQLPATTILVSAVKGIEHGSGKRMSEILTETFPNNPTAVLSGPNQAQEVARSIPTATVIGCRPEKLAGRLQQIISTKTFRAYTSRDVVGIELGGALKNIFALAAGMSDGIGLGDNSKAALVTRSLAELVRLGTALGGKRETFQGLSGVGDLIVTCFSRQSRNRRVGERLGKGDSLNQIMESMEMVAEGVPTTRSAKECAARLGIQTPIIDEMHAVLYEKAAVAEAMRRLLSRELRTEED